MLGMMGKCMHATGNHPISSGLELRPPMAPNRLAARGRALDLAAISATLKMVLRQLLRISLHSIHIFLINSLSTISPLGITKSHQHDSSHNMLGMMGKSLHATKNHTTSSGRKLWRTSLAAWGRALDRAAGSTTLNKGLWQLLRTSLCPHLHKPWLSLVSCTPMESLVCALILTASRTGWSQCLSIKTISKINLSRQKPKLLHVSSCATARVFWCIVIGNKVVLLGIMLAFSARLNVNLHVFGNKNGPVNKAYINQNEVAQRQL